MNKQQKQQLEQKLSVILGCNVELVPGRTVVPMHKDQSSAEMQLLEMENRQRLAVARREAMEEERKQKRLVNRFMKKVESVAKSSAEMINTLREELPTIVEELPNIIEEIPTKLANSSIVNKTLDYFFAEEVEVIVREEIVFDGHYDHTKRDAVEEGNVVYLSRDFKDIETIETETTQYIDK